MSKKTVITRILVLVVALLVTCLACATTRYSYPGHKTFIEDNIEQIRVGMGAEELQSIFGEPDETFRASFGAAVGSEWEGEVWLYFTSIDPSYKYVKRYKKNTFVFVLSNGKLKLNHWELEQ